MMAFALLCVVVLASGCAKEDKPEAQMWDSTEWVVLGEFDIDGLNASPMKEIAVDGYEWVEVKAEYKAKDEIYLLNEVYYEDSNEKWPIARMAPLAKEGEVIVKAPVKKGSRFQVLTQAFQKDGSYDGDYIVDMIRISYRLTN